MTKNTIKSGTKKSTKKATTFIPMYVIDLTRCTSVEDVVKQFAINKILCTLNVAELESFVDTVIDLYSCAVEAKSTKLDLTNGNKYIISSDGIELKKPNIFTRFWNWITRK